MRTVAIAVLVLSLSGCWLFETQYVALDEQTVATLQAKWGEDIEGMRADVEALLGAQVAGLKHIDGKLTAVLEPAAVDAVEVGAETFIGKVFDDPTVQGVVGGALAALLSALGVVQTRKKLQRKKK